MSQNAVKPVRHTDPARRTGSLISSRERSRKMLLGATLAAILLMFIPMADIALYPLRLFITFVHESGHALAALITGGSVLSVQIDPSGSGLTQTMNSPLTAWITLSGGYLGTALFGALLLHIGRLRRGARAGKTALIVGSILMAAATLLWARDSFTFGAGIILTLTFFALGRWLPADAADFTISFIAVQCCLNAVGDLRILLNLTASGRGDNDAVFMAQHYGLPPTFWALLWAAMAGILLFCSLRNYWHATKSA